MPPERFDAVVVGAGPAGLATSRELARRGVRHLVLERGEAVGWSWRQAYDSLTLHTGKHLSALPGLGFGRAAPLFLPRDAFVEYLVGYAAHFSLPVRTRCDLRRARRSDGEWVLETGAGEIRARRLVLATGIMANPHRPEFPGGHRFGGRVLHSVEYRAPEPFIGRRVLVHLHLPDEPELYGAWLAVLLALFVLRVVGQVVVVLARPRWLPPMREWYSGLMPYRVLLPVQVAFIVVMVRMTTEVWSGGVGWASAHGGLGAVLVWSSFVYAGGMVVRFVVWLRCPPETRRAWIPIIFHLVLAAFLWVFGSWHIAAG